MRGLSCTAGRFCLAVVLTATFGSFGRSDFLVTSSTSNLKSAQLYIVEKESGTGRTAAAAFEPESRPIAIGESLNSTQKELAIQLLSVMVIPTGKLYIWTPPLTPLAPPPSTAPTLPPPTPPSVSPKPVTPTPPTTIPPEGTPPGPSNQTPEPSSLVLAGLGLGILGWKRKKAHQSRKSENQS